MTITPESCYIQVKLKLKEMKFNVDFNCILQIYSHQNHKQSILLQKISISPRKASFSYQNNNWNSIVVDKSIFPQFLQIDIFLVTSTSRLLIQTFKLPIDRPSMYRQLIVFSIRKCPDKSAFMSFQFEKFYSSYQIKDLIKKPLQNRQRTSKNTERCNKQLQSVKKTTKYDQHDKQTPFISPSSKKLELKSKFSQSTVKFYTNLRNNSKNKIFQIPKLIQQTDRTKKYQSSPRKLSIDNDYFPTHSYSKQIITPKQIQQGIQKIPSLESINKRNISEEKYFKTFSRTTGQTRSKQNLDSYFRFQKNQQCPQKTFQISRNANSMKNISSNKQKFSQNFLEYRGTKFLERQNIRLQKKVNKFQQKISEYKQIINNLNAQLRKSEGRLRAMQKSMDAQFQNMQSYIVNREKFQKKLQKYLSKVQQQNVDLSCNLKRLQVQYEKLSKQLQQNIVNGIRIDANKMNELINEQRQKNNKQILVIRRQNQKLRKQIQRLQKQIQKNIQSKIQKQHIKIQNQVNKKQIKDNKIQKEDHNNNLRNNKQIQIEKINFYIQQINNLKSKLMSSLSSSDQLQATINQMNQQIISLQNQLLFKDQYISNLNNIITNLKLQVEKQSNEIIQLKSSLSDKQKQLFEAGSYNLSKDNVIQQKQTEIQMYKNQIVLLKIEIQNLKKNSKLTRSIQSSKKLQQLEIQKNIKFNLQQLQELQNLDKQNKRLAQENKQLSKALKIFRKQDVSLSQMESQIFQLPHEILKEISFMKQQKQEQSQIYTSSQAIEQSGESQKGPKKRKLMRKHRIQVDMDNLNTEAINS